MNKIKFSLNPFLKYSIFNKNINCNSEAFDFHTSMLEYKNTPLISLQNLAEKIGLKNIFIKDESNRFKLNSFKVLGASFAIYKFIKEKWENKFKSPFNHDSFKDFNKIKKLGSITLATATDGNHGHAVAWTAKILKIKAVVFVPNNTVIERIEDIKNEGAKVIISEGNYDFTVKLAAAQAEKNNWDIISDTAYENYEKIPNFIMQGYETIFKEINEYNKLQNFNFIFIQTGVGGLACAAVNSLMKFAKKKRPKLICIEPINADCMLESIQNINGEICTTKGNLNSIMAGLNCGIPSKLAWPKIKKNFTLFLAIEDSYAINAMNTFFYPNKNDQKIISCESGAAGLGGLLAICKNEKLKLLKNKLNLCKESNILLINTEGNTDKKRFKNN